MIALVIGACTSCEKSDSDVIGEVELYLLSAYETVNETPEIDLATVVLSEDPLLSYSDFRSYSAKEYFFEVTDRAKENRGSGAFHRRNCFCGDSK